jgi:hypothetical protein
MFFSELIHKIFVVGYVFVHVLNNNVKTIFPKIGR